MPPVPFIPAIALFTESGAIVAGVFAGAVLVLSAIRLQFKRRELERVLSQKNRELEETKSRAEESNRVREQFLANISHEIRTPMNGILGMTQLALATSLDGEQLEYLQRTKESAESLLKILNDLLDLSRIDSRRIDIENQPFDLRSAVNAAVSAFESAAQAKRLELVIHVSEDVPAAVLGDAGHLSQVLSYLIDNAVKYTATGDVTVEAHPTGSAGAFTFIEFAVTDTGVGLSSERVEAIFEPFHQSVDGAKTESGAGLGLTIAQKLVQLMGGTLNVVSQPGQGSRFWFALPLRRGKEIARKEPEPIRIPSTPLRVLLAEDNPVNQRVAVRLLEKHGHIVEVATTGLEAVAMLDRGAYDLVLMDVHMPEMDGLTATRLVREREAKTVRHTPVLAMTANAMRGDREKCLSAGMDDYISKPFQAEQLLNAVYALAAKSFQTPA